MNIFELFISFLWVGLFSVGGGYAAIPLIQNEVTVSHAWLSMREFTDLVTIAEMTPGPIAVNAATFVGIRLAGLPGVLAATAGCIFPSCIIVSALAFLYYRYKDMSVLQSILASLRPVVVALIASAGISILLTAVFDGRDMNFVNINGDSLTIFTAAFIILRKLKWNPIMVMGLCGVSELLFKLASGIS